LLKWNGYANARCGVDSHLEPAQTTPIPRPGAHRGERAHMVAKTLIQL